MFEAGQFRGIQELGVESGRYLGLAGNPLASA
jgi:hypothetical protein